MALNLNYFHRLIAILYCHIVIVSVIDLPKKYVINGNARAKNLKTVAYINSVEKTSMIDVITLPQLPKEQYYEIWAELQDRMVNLGILDESNRKLKQIPYMEDALALSIKIGTKGNDANENDTEVAEISLKEKQN